MTAVIGTLHWTETWPTPTTRTRTAHVDGVDVWTPLRAWLAEHARTYMTCTHTLDTCELRTYTTPVANAWGFVFEYEPPDASNPSGLGLLVKPGGGFGFSNLDYYVSTWLACNNASAVAFECTPDTLTLRALPDTVQPLLYTHVNACAVDTDIVHTVCRIGAGAECCAFLTLGVAGWECAKFDSTGRTLLDRATAGRMTARRIGSCRVVGRIADTVAPVDRINRLAVKDSE